MLKALVTTVVLGLTVAVGATPQASAGDQPASQLTISVDKDLVTYGGNVTVSTTLTVNSVVIQGATVSMYRKEYPATEFSLVGSVATNSNGKASFTVQPAKNTVYRWEFAGNEGAAASQSATKAVNVRPVVTLTLQDDQISSGQRMVAKGTIAPSKAGSPVYLWRRTIAGTPSKWLTRTIQSDGSFKFAKRINSTNAYKLFAVVPGGAGLGKGTSPTLTLFIGP